MRADVDDCVGILKLVASTRRVVIDIAGTPKGVAGISRVTKTAESLRAKASAQHSELLLALLIRSRSIFLVLRMRRRTSRESSSVR